MYKDKKTPFLLEIDDETDEDILAALLENQPPPGIALMSSERMLQNVGVLTSTQMLIAVKRVRLGEGRRRLNHDFANMFRNVYARLCFKVHTIEGKTIIFLLLSKS